MSRDSWFLTALISLALISSSQLVVSRQTVKEKHISALVSSKWSETPLLLEASEFIYRNNAPSFWSFAVDVTKNSNEFRTAETSNNKSYVDEVLSKAAKHVSPMQFDLLKLTLLIRSYSPAIEMSRKLAEEALIGAPSKCLTFVDVHGQVTCDVDKIESLVKSAVTSKKPFVYQFDKYYEFAKKTSQTGSEKCTVILYTQIGTLEFDKFHSRLVEMGKSGEINYLLRHNYAPNPNDQSKVALSGYGVELDIKSTEYKAKDDANVNAAVVDEAKVDAEQKERGEQPIQGFVFDTLKEQNPALTEKLDEFKKHLIDSQLELAPLKAWQMQDLSLQAAQKIIDASSGDEALRLLEDLSQNFPLRSRALSKISVRSELKKTFKAQRQTLESRFGMEAGTGSLYLNGLELNIDIADIFSLTSVLRKEARLLESLHQVGLELGQMRDLIYLDTSSKNNDYGVDMRDSSIQWVNDLESDKKYAYWSKSVHDILRPTYPGMMRSIGKNFYNLLFVLDPAKEASKTLLKTAESFYVNDIPIRIGFVFVTNDNEQTDGYVDASVALFRAHNYVKLKTNSAAKALSFLTDIYAKATKASDITADMVVKEFKRRYPKETHLDDVFGPDSDYDEGRKLSMEYYNKIGLKTLPQVILNGFPMSESEIEADVFEESIITKIMHLTQEIQMAVYKGHLDDSRNIMDWLMDRETIMPRLNPRILTQERQYLVLSDLDNKSKKFLESLKYISNDNHKIHPLTIWLVCDPDTEKGRQLLYDAINFYESSKVNSRIAVILQKTSNDDVIKRILSYALNNLDSTKAFTVLKRIIKEKTFNDLKSNKISISQLDLKVYSIDSDEFEKGVKDLDLSKILDEHREFLQTSTTFKDNTDSGLFANGWIIGPFDENESFIDNDFSLLESFILKIGLRQIKELVEKWNKDDFGKSLDDTIVKIHSIIGKYSSNEKRVKSPEFTTGMVHVKPRKSDAPFYDLVAIVDPLTRHAQKVSTILRTLSEIANVNLNIYFNCKEKLSAPPLKSFYRYVLESELKFDDSSKQIKPIAFFRSMPQSPILTLNIHSPESWMVEAVHSPYDLDNIHLSEVTDSDVVYGEFELEHLLVEGHAFDILTGQPPRGLQFNLGTIANPVMYDTIVMANLGYFQLKASPGMWFLQLRDGRSKEIYEIVSHENTDSESKRTSNIIIVMDNFESKVIRVKVSKKADKLNENLLDDTTGGDKEGSGGLWDSLASSFSGGGPSGVEESAEKKQNVLNIFSVASGHLYERLLRIMMLTVLKNTQAKVKFWFLKNYLSPQFTRFLPYYAEKYNFDYELVQYKWPRWLHHESEKQRIIWGYKILFLDVLFPLNVEKIIYVDADQIVRADLTELRDLDLKGAPYGYTPFCDSRKEMDGYRFWKTGYWQMHLGPRKYHISALYVVDLKKFRKIAAGDRLRGQYQGLSQDPNSLSNLDQDLPNNMIHQVNIFSLPQEWLYCDTWCSSDTLSKAKTIDLCNNPQTKEPKLQAAMRIVPEWKDYDNEVKALIQKWQSESAVPSTPPPTSTTKDPQDQQHKVPEKEDL